MVNRVPINTESLGQNVRWFEETLTMTPDDFLKTTSM